MAQDRKAENIKLLVKAMEGDPEAQFLLGQNLRQIPSFLKEGIKWLKQSADQGHVPACLVLGEIYDKSFIKALAPIKEKEVIGWLQKAFDGGSPKAGLLLAKINFNNIHHIYRMILVMPLTHPSVANTPELLAAQLNVKKDFLSRRPNLTNHGVYTDFRDDYEHAVGILLDKSPSVNSKETQLKARWKEWLCVLVTVAPDYSFLVSDPAKLFDQLFTKEPPVIRQAILAALPPDISRHIILRNKNLSEFENISRDYKTEFKAALPIDFPSELKELAASYVEPPLTDEFIQKPMFIFAKFINECALLKELKLTDDSEIEARDFILSKAKYFSDELFIKDLAGKKIKPKANVSPEQFIEALQFLVQAIELRLASIKESSADAKSTLSYLSTSSSSSSSSSPSSSSSTSSRSSSSSTSPHPSTSSSSSISSHSFFPQAPETSVFLKRCQEILDLVPQSLKLKTQLSPKK